MIAPQEETPLLDFGSDLHLRHRWFTEASLAHPAKMHLGLVQWITERYTRPGDTIADPMAGIGSTLYCATLARHVIAREIEPRWREILHRNAAHIIARSGLFAGRIDVGQADAREPWGYRVDHVIFSPPYGNEANTTPNRNRALQYRLRTGRIDYGSRWQSLLESPTDGSASMVSFHYGNHPAQVGHFRGRRYWMAMSEIYRNAYESLSSGYLVLVLKDHIADGVRVETARQTVEMCESIGFALVDWHQRKLSQLSFWQRLRKEKELPVVEEEDILVFCKGRSGKG